ncbi:MAG: PEP-CTERM sorting domain-containing protein [Verrucomicrobiae bacterium]|nr:PEP-CTERM sorting domain-containing protein [Verrucomicrobiae bacterium]NNJ86136.1 PEP-CTERM sorting domain-containing protein [Akkermansiaceae bacterium]
MKHKKTNLIVAATSLLALGSSISSSHAATIIASEGFEGNTGSWTTTGLYTYGGTGTNFATDGTGAINLNSGNAILTSALDLDSGGASDLTVSFDIHWDGGSSTTRHLFDISLDGGTTWVLLGNTQNSSPYNDNSNEDGDGLTQTFPVSFTIQEGNGTVAVAANSNWRTVGEQWAGQTFTDNTLFRFRDSASKNAYIDNVEISSLTYTPVPEPSAAALLGLAGLALILRRRK